MTDTNTPFPLITSGNIVYDEQMHESKSYHETIHILWLYCDILYELYMYLEVGTTLSIVWPYLI